MKRKTIKAIMGFALSAVILTTSFTGVLAAGTDAQADEEQPVLYAAATDEADAQADASDTAEGSDTAEVSDTAEGSDTADASDTAEVPDTASDAVTTAAEESNASSTEADTEQEVNTSKPYLALGANLKDSEKSEVLKLLGIDEAKLDEYTVLSVTNEEEHKYLDKYVDKSKIGTRALSSIVIREAKEGAGLNFNIYNIDYCTVGMYKNVCTTVGIKDADITIAGPFKLSGTAALIGIIKAYEEMTGETVSEDVADAAMNELVVTGELENSIDGEPEEVEAFMADLKAQLSGLKSESDIKEAIKNTAAKYNLSLSETDINNIYYLLDKLKGLNLDWDFIEQQANDLVELWNEGNMDSFWDKIVAFIKELFKSLKGLFN